jgi:hypothetical protein
MRRTHRDSSPARTATPLTYAAHICSIHPESSDNRSPPTLVTRIPMKTTTRLLPGGPRASPELVRY